MSNFTSNAMPKDKILANRKFLTVVFMGVLLALALVFSMPVAQAARPLVPPPPPPVGGGGGFHQNIDVPFNIDPICGFEITVIADREPQSNYDGHFNPWGDPTIVNDPPGSNRWKLIFGNPDGSGPCFKRDHFSRGTHEKPEPFMLHFGFSSDNPVIAYDPSACRFIARGGAKVRCNAPIIGLAPLQSKWMLGVTNMLDRELAVENVRWVLVDTPVAINDLMPTLTEHGTPLWLENNIIPAAQGDQPGILSIDLPAELQGQHGHLVMSYDVRDLANPEQFSTVTMATLLQ
jgi:hypothetical protein